MSRWHPFQLGSGVLLLSPGAALIPSLCLPCPLPATGWETSPRLGAWGRWQPKAGWLLLSDYCYYSWLGGTLLQRNRLEKEGAPVLWLSIHGKSVCEKVPSGQYPRDIGWGKRAAKTTYKLENLSLLPDEHQKVGSRSQTGLQLDLGFELGQVILLLCDSVFCF